MFRIICIRIINDIFNCREILNLMDTDEGNKNDKSIAISLYYPSSFKSIAVYFRNSYLHCFKCIGHVKWYTWRSIISGIYLLPFSINSDMKCNNHTYGEYSSPSLANKVKSQPNRVVRLHILNTECGLHFHCHYSKVHLNGVVMPIMSSSMVHKNQFGNY